MADAEQSTEGASDDHVRRARRRGSTGEGDWQAVEGHALTDAIERMRDSTDEGDWQAFVFGRPGVGEAWSRRVAPRLQCLSQGTHVLTGGQAYEAARARPALAP